MYILVNINLVECNNILGIYHKKIINRTLLGHQKFCWIAILLAWILALVLVSQKDILGAQKTSKRDVAMTDRG